MTEWFCVCFGGGGGCDGGVGVLGSVRSVCKRHAWMCASLLRECIHVQCMSVHVVLYDGLIFLPKEC
jgi:hypothetical protein